MTAREARQIATRTRPEHLDLTYYLDKVYAHVKEAADKRLTELDYLPLISKFPPDVRYPLDTYLTQQGYRIVIHPKGETLTW